MLDTAVSRRTELLLLSLLLIVAGILRMGWPGLTEFKADEARLLGLALDMTAGQFALRGISSSVGFPNFPASVWVYSLPLFIWPHPYAATIFTGLLNTLAVGAAYWFVRRYWGVSAALAATLMLAVSPWAIIFSRKIWAQNLLPLFVMGWALGAALALVERKPRFIWLHFICMALAIQIHLAAVALVPATLLLLIIFRKRARWKTVFAGAALAALTALPFVIYLEKTLVETGLPSSLSTETTTVFAFDSINFTSMLSLGTYIHSLAGPAAFEAYLAQLPPLTWVYLLWGALILGGILWLVWQIWRNWQAQTSQVGVILLVWLLIPPLVFLWQATPVFLHYFIATLPAQYMIAGIFFSRIPYFVLRIRPQLTPYAIRNTRLIGWAILLATAVFQLYAIITLHTFLARNNTPGAFGTPLAHKLDAVEQAKTLLEKTAAAEILAVGPGEFPKTDDFPAVYDVLLRGTPHRFVDMGRDALFPAQNAAVILHGKEIEDVWTGDLYLETAVTVTEFPLRPGEGFLYVLELAGSSKPQPETAVDPPYLLANWVNMLGHDQPQRVDSEKAVWQIHWRTGDNPDPANYQFFNHLLDNSGQRVSQLDAPAFWPAQWQAGDALISRFLMPWPDSASVPLTMRVGMYRYPSLENVPLLDAAGNPYTDAADFTITKDP